MCPSPTLDTAHSDPTTELLCQRVTELRQSHQFTLEQLAAASGVSRSMLSQIERGQTNPTLGVTFRIARAFGMSIGELVDGGSHRISIEVVHGNDPNHLFRADDQCQIRTLSPLHLEKSVEFYELRIEPDSALESTAHFDGTKEMFTLTRGKVRIHSGDTHCDLAAGDSAHYRADISHRIENVGGNQALGYLIVSYR